MYNMPTDGPHCPQADSPGVDDISTVYVQATDTELADVAVQEAVSGEVQMESDLDELLDWVFDQSTIDSFSGDEHNLEIKTQNPCTNTAYSIFNTNRTYRDYSKCTLYTCITIQFTLAL